jgi:hypothetical protein
MAYGRNSQVANMRPWRLLDLARNSYFVVIHFTVFTLPVSPSKYPSDRRVLKGKGLHVALKFQIKSALLNFKSLIKQPTVAATTPDARGCLNLL